MDDKQQIQRNKHQTSGQVDHVDQILNEIMQNRERRTNNNNNNNSTSYDWLESDSYGTTQQLDSNIQEWHPEQHLEQIGDHRIDYYLDYGSKVIPDHHLQQQPHQNQNQQQLLQNQNQQYHHNHQNHQQQHQQSMYQNFHDYHDQSLLNNSGYYDVNSSNIPSLSSSSSSASNSTSSSSRYNPDPMIHNINRGQPAARHHIQQVHPRNSALHSTNPATRQSQQPPQVLDRGIYQRNGPSSYSPSPPPPPPANLLVHQQYRPSPPPPQHRQYDDRYSHQQHTSSLQSLQQTQGQSNSQNPQYSNMSHYDLSAHVRNQGALNWSTGSIPILGGNNGIGNGNGNNNNNLNNRQLNLNSSSNSSISSSSSTSAANRARYQNSPTTSLSYPNNNGNNNMNNINNNNPSNFLVNGGLGNNNNNNNNNTRSLLVHPSGIQASQSRGNNNNGNNSNNNSPNNILNRNNDMAGRDIELEQLIYRNAKAILAETANRCLKSVELANALRDRIGKEALQRTKVLYGGLLVLLELYRETFAVHRIPKNDMVELLAYVPPQYSTHNIQHPQQLLASQIPGYNITTPNLTTNNSFPNGSLLNGVNATYPSNKDNTVPITSNPNQSLQTSNQLLNLTTSSLIQTLTSQQVPTKCLFISNIPDEISGNQIWAEFGGENIVEKVSIDFQGNQRTGVVWFTSVNAAKAALNIPSLIKWKDVLSFIDPADVAPPTIISSTLSENSGDIEVINTTDNAQSIINLQSQSNSNNNNNNRNDHNNNNINISIDDPYGPPPGLSEPTNLPYLPGRVNGNGNNNSNNNNGGKNPFFDVVVAMPDNFNFISNDNIDDNLNLVVDLTSLTISDSHSDGYTGTPITSAEQSPNDSPRGNFRKAAPPPILTSDLNSLSAESLTPNSGKSLSPSGSPNSTPGGTPNLSFTFFDSSAPGGITTLPKETLPKVIHDVMNTLCDIYYVPQKTWEKSPIGDYLFCQAIVDILSGQFNGVFVQMTKLKQQLKRKLGGSIRIGPLKALVIAYPEYFEVDRTVNLVRSLKTELPYMDISVITSA